MPTVTGLAFIDADGSGSFTAGDTVQAGVTVQLVNSANAVVGAAVSDSSGNYSITAPDGSYTLVASPPAGLAANCPTGTKKYAVTFLGTNLTGADFPLTVTSKTISGNVFNDLNNSNVRDGAEVGMAGVTVQLLNASNGAVVGTATTDANGNYSITAPPGNYSLRVVNPAGFAASCGSGNSLTTSYNVTIGSTNLGGLDFAMHSTNTAPTFTSPSSNSGVAGSPLSAVTATDAENNTPFTFSVVSGALPTGTSLNPNGTISGTPTSPGTYTATIGVTDSLGASRQQVFTWTITAANTPPTFTSSTSNTVAAGAAFPTITASDAEGNTPLAFSLVAGALPSGVTLNSNGSISGTTTSAGTYSATVRVADSLGAATQQNFTWTVSPATPPTITSPSSSSVGTGHTPSTLTATDPGSFYPLTFSVVSGSVPTGTTLLSNGTFSGTASTPGTYTALVQVTDAAGASSTKSLTWIVTTIIATRTRCRC